MQWIILIIEILFIYFRWTFDTDSTILWPQVEKKQKKKLLLDYLYDNLKNHNWWEIFPEFSFGFMIIDIANDYWIIDIANEYWIVDITNYYWIIDITNFYSRWAYRYFFCELLALLNVIGNYCYCYIVIGNYWEQKLKKVFFKYGQSLPFLKLNHKYMLVNWLFVPQIAFWMNSHLWDIIYCI